MTCLLNSINIVIFGSRTSAPLYCSFPPTAINHTQCDPTINVDREWIHLSVTETGGLICKM